MRRTRHAPLTLAIGFAVGLLISASSCALGFAATTVSAEPRTAGPGLGDPFLPAVKGR